MSDVIFSRFRSPSARDLASLTLRSLGHVRYRPPTACVRPDGWHVDVLVHTVGGCARGVIDGVRSTATAGSLWIHPRDRAYRFDIDPKVAFWEGRWIEVDGAWLRPLIARLGLAGVHHVPGCAGAAGVVDELFACFRAAGAERGEGDADDHAGALIWRILAIAGDAARRRRARVDPSGLAVERARRFALTDLGRAIRLDDLARAAGLSPFHFARVFKARTGASPIDWLRGARLARAQELLRAGEDIKRVARAVGYGSAAHFTTAFTRQVGYPPGAFRDHAVGDGRGDEA
ncbi:MAG TPA: AraC family transcriptional regulator [Planctomycetota bacterium]|nr:AraC family transcriptional regulator [Planctomycetota bacterium]